MGGGTRTVFKYNKKLLTIIVQNATMCSVTKPAPVKVCESELFTSWLFYFDTVHYNTSNHIVLLNV